MISLNRGERKEESVHSRIQRRKKPLFLSYYDLYTPAGTVSEKEKDKDRVQPAHERDDERGGEGKGRAGTDWWFR